MKNFNLNILYNNEAKTLTIEDGNNKPVKFENVGGSIDAKDALSTYLDYYGFTEIDDKHFEEGSFEDVKN